MSVKFLHCADLHLDSPFDSLPEYKASCMRREMRELLNFIADLANSRRADIVFLSGDLLDSTVSYYETSDALIEALERIDGKVFISPGNHDYFCSMSPYAYLDFPENVHIFKSQTVECVELPELGCRVYGAAFIQNDSASLLNAFTAEDDGMINLMCIHGNVNGDSYNRITGANMLSSGIDYMALGHIHARSELSKAGDTFFAYPGCPQGRGFDETGDKGVYFGEVSKGDVRLEFIPTCRRRYMEYTVDVTDFPSVKEAALSVLASAASEDIIRIVFTGETDEEINLTALCDELADYAFHLVLKNKTHHRRDLWEGLSEDTLKGSFLRLMHRRLDAAETEDERATVMAAVRYALAAMENREES
ncbi:MAG: DNA repair exonuclease [Oscillospiraceae bacterium]|nr:DNA repair exonuclease [Oscillospiraceae bacterium]